MNFEVNPRGDDFYIIRCYYYWRHEQSDRKVRSVNNTLNGLVGV